MKDDNWHYPKRAAGLLGTFAARAYVSRAGVMARMLRQRDAAADAITRDATDWRWAYMLRYTA